MVVFETHIADDLFRSTMSSQLTSLVPVLDGTNYQQWAAAMQSFLMSQGQWKCTKPGAYNPGHNYVKKTDSEGASSSKLEIDEDVSRIYEELAEKALGNIRLHLHHTIGYQHNEESDPSALWNTLRKPTGFLECLRHSSSLKDSWRP